MQPNTFLYAALHWIAWLILLVGGIGAVRNGLIVGEVALVAWVLWVAVGSRAAFFQRYVAIKNGKKSETKRVLQNLQKQQEMSYEYKTRFRELEKTRKQILDAVKSNKRMDVEIIQPELDKIEVLLDAFIRTAVSHKKIAKYLEENPEAAIATEAMRVEKALSEMTASTDDMTRKNLLAQKEMVDKRSEERRKMAGSVTALAVQLDTIEKTLTYLKTKVIAFDTPAQLQAEITSVVSGLEAAERTLAETDKMEEEIRRMAQRVGVNG